MTRKGAWTTGIAILAIVVIVAACGLWRDGRSRELGAELFDGRQALVGAIQGHDLVLPPIASRCSNCHRIGVEPADVPAAQASFGPVFSSASLSDDRSRRGGPASHFDVTSFCRLLRTGVDPAGVLMTRAMPRYQVSDADCSALWAHLSRS